MKHLRINFFTLLTVLLVSGSCVSKKQLTYLQYAGAGSPTSYANIDPRLTVTPGEYRLMPYDNLFIRVATPDARWSEIFNVMPTGSGGAMTEESAGLLGYPVDIHGDIEIQFIGKVNVGGLTLSETKAKLDSVFKNYVNDASLTVRMVNNSITVIGEVRMPGRFPIMKERLNVFEAVAMAGDLNEYSNRQKVQVIRPTEYGPVVKEFSLRNRDILTSEYYYVMPNDIIYAQPLKGRSFMVNTPVYSLFFTAITTALVLITFISPAR